MNTVLQQYMDEMVNMDEKVNVRVINNVYVIPKDLKSFNRKTDDDDKKTNEKQTELTKQIYK